MEVVIGNKVVIGEAVSPPSFRSSPGRASYLDAGRVPEQAEPRFRMKSALSSADELICLRTLQCLSEHKCTSQFFKER